MSHPRQGIKDIPNICSQHGVKQVVITPGSRNAPLIISFNQEKNLTCLSITDERSAGYFALGIAQVLGNPVGLVCTSGTAALNFGPAIAEACYQNLPLIVFTADRPLELIDQSDGQTIRQSEVFKNHVKQSYNFPVETSSEADLSFSHRMISEAIEIAMQNPRGPVHINVPIREPLYTKLPELSNNIRIIKTASSQIDISDATFELLFSRWQNYRKKMIIAGFGTPDERLNNALSEITKDDSVVIVAENISNLCNDRFICSPERFFASIAEDKKTIYKPDLLITFGNSVVSKRLKQYLRTFKPDEHWSIVPWNDYTDTFQRLTMNIPIYPVYFFEKILAKNASANTLTDYAELYHKKEQEIVQHHADFLSSALFSDIKVFEQVLSAIPPGYNLHLANSTPVRYAQLFETRSDLGYYSNRGTSGIDGCLSTAAGSVYASEKPTTIIAGDLAFIYDSNALWNNYLSENFRIIVLNNGGGNIFTLIETSSEITTISDFFETPHKVNLNHLSAAFGIKHYFCDNPEDMKKQLDVFFTSPGPSVLEIKTDGKTNTKVYKDYFRKLKQ